jgi:hypothetical protein
LRKLLATLILFSATQARAEHLDSEKDLFNLETHAFISQGYIFSTENNYLADSKNGTFDFTESGINFTKQINDRLRAGIQLFARNLGPNEDHDAQFDWYYIDYRWTDALGLRLGRVKIPFGLYNEISDVDSARVPILLPQSIYPSSNRNFLLAQTGGELYGYAKLGGFGALDYRVYNGTIHVEAKSSPSSPTQIDTIAAPYVAGSRILWETPLDGLRMGGSVQVLRLDSTLVVATKKVNVEIPVTLWVASMEYAKGNWLLSSEYARWHVDVRSSEPSLFPESKTTSERMYGMASYRFTDKFQAGTYYSLIYPNVEHQSGRKGKQHDMAATLRYDINSNWLVKLEGHYMRGTGGVSSALNEGVPQNDLTENWSAFLVKTTVFF